VNDLLKNCKVNYINLCGYTTILQAAAIMSKSRLVLGVDTGLSHIACAVGTANVVLMASFIVGVFFPYTALTSAIYLPTTCMNCESRCNFDETICLQRIRPSSVEYVIDYTLKNELKKPRVFLENECVDVSPTQYQKLDSSNFTDYVEIINL
jgi:ADP-heptose:LPS heptosyltransferase